MTRLVAGDLQRPGQGGAEFRLALVRLAEPAQRPHAHPVAERGLAEDEIHLLVRIEVRGGETDLGEGVVRQRVLQPVHEVAGLDLLRLQEAVEAVIGGRNVPDRKGRRDPRRQAVELLQVLRRQVHDAALGRGEIAQRTDIEDPAPAAWDIGIRRQVLLEGLSVLWKKGEPLADLGRPQELVGGTDRLHHAPQPRDLRASGVGWRKPGIGPAAAREREESRQEEKREARSPHRVLFRRTCRGPSIAPRAWRPQERIRRSSSRRIRGAPPRDSQGPSRDSRGCSRVSRAPSSVSRGRSRRSRRPSHDSRGCSRGRVGPSPGSRVRSRGSAVSSHGSSGGSRGSNGCC